MTLRQHVFRCCCGAALALLSISLPSASSQTMPASSNFMPTREPEINPAKQVSAELRGDLFAARQRYLDAIAAYREAPQDSAIVVNKMGVAYHHMFDIADARKNYQRAIQLDPKYAEAYNNLGATYHAEKNYKEAQRCYRKAIKLNPNSPLFYSNLGTAYFFQGNAKKGAEAYREAFALDPMVFEQSAASRIEEGSSSKDLAMVNYVLAKTYAQAGMNDRALAYLRKAIGEGFNDKRRLMTDHELASLRETAEFAALMQRERSQ